MKIAVISDIHGNFPALAAILNDIEKEKAETVYCLGDLVGYYCMINEVIDTMREKNIPSLMGNHDYALVHDNGVIGRSKTATNILSRHLTTITKENLQYLQQCGSNFTFTLGQKSFYCVHGGLADPVDEYIRDIDSSYFEKNHFTHDVLISGHTHFPQNKLFDGKRYLNPGSVGQPRDGNPASSYLLLMGNEYVHKRVPYDIDRICFEMKKHGYDSYIYQNLYKGKGVGSE